MGEYVGEYDRGYSGAYYEFRLQLIFNCIEECKIPASLLFQALTVGFCGSQCWVSMLAETPEC